MSKKTSASAMVRDLLARVGAPPPSGGETKPADRETNGPDCETEGASAALARENARAALRRAQGLPPLPAVPAPPGRAQATPPSTPQGLAPKPHRIAPAASVPVWRSDVARRVRVERAGGRCECAGACGSAHGATSGDARCAVREGDWIAGPGDYPTEPRRAVLVAETLDRSRSARDPDNMEIRCPECAAGIARQALQMAPAKAGRRGGVAAQVETETGMEFD